VQNKSSQKCDYLSFTKEDNSIIFNLNQLTWSVCKEKFYVSNQFLNTPPFLLIHVDAKTKVNVNVKELPNQIEINSFTYKFLFCNFKPSPQQFKAIFMINNKFFLVDDLKNKELIDQIPDYLVDLCFYYLN